MAQSAQTCKSPEDIDKILQEIETALELQELSMVKSERREYNVISKLEAVQKYMEALLRDSSGRDKLVEVFGGDCVRLARYRLACEDSQLSDRVASRLAACTRTCESLESVIGELGLSQRLLEAKQSIEETRAAHEEDDGTHEDGDEHNVLPHLASIAVMGSEAIACEQAGDMTSALEKYRECGKNIQTAILVYRAIQKFKEGLHAEGASTDIEALEAHAQQLQQRVEYLENLDPATDGNDLIGVEEHIQAPELAAAKDKKKRKKVLASCAAIGAAGGVVLLGPFSAMLAVGGAIVAGAVSAGVASQDTALGDRVYSAGEKGLHKAGKAVEKAAAAADEAAKRMKKKPEDAPSEGP
mmetsp:Transcript_65693/g.137325  ORF Transcript_65693/g.137325 Transcript_65693/m.137325 type:complete len:356 (-) Transcript_65693:229-1296(-)|eukprot:CAMPEP_0206461950 /NCGR_PEP_ID=MMETSP0324_2-20121206/25677_1 /ASSEMBLY_ACC=CAM_ASM_000836 /TAXON_ID=2866 /ORGANISM="Crypthecodinium cohnii, Strain Seligo" /LENGTH=355 /DNA_ID=CAMNT_0053933991 /DNA_START=86 /DNA_END=1153 /DNA_ORIENTATION=-